MFDHVRAMDVTEHHEGDPTGWSHRLRFHGPITASPELKTNTSEHRLDLRFFKHVNEVCFV